MPYGAFLGKRTTGGGIVIPAKYIIFGEKEHKKNYIFKSRRFWPNSKFVSMLTMASLGEGAILRGGFSPLVLFLRKGGGTYWNMGV